MYVLYVYIYMYVQNLTIGLEHINQKRWAIPHCVLESYIIMPAGCDEINQVLVSLFDLYPLWEHGDAVRGQQPQLLHVDTPCWVMLHICHPFVLATRIPPPQSRWHLTADYLTTPSFVGLFGVQHTDTCHVSLHTSAARAPLFSQISRHLDSDRSL